MANIYGRNWNDLYITYRVGWFRKYLACKSPLSKLCELFKLNIIVIFLFEMYKETTSNPEWCSSCSHNIFPLETLKLIISHLYSTLRCPLRWVNIKRKYYIFSILQIICNRCRQRWCTHWPWHMWKLDRSSRSKCRKLYIFSSHTTLFWWNVQHWLTVITDLIRQICLINYS